MGRETVGQEDPRRRVGVTLCGVLRTRRSAARSICDSVNPFHRPVLSSCLILRWGHSVAFRWIRLMHRLSICLEMSCPTHLGVCELAASGMCILTEHRNMGCVVKLLHPARTRFPVSRAARYDVEPSGATYLRSILSHARRD